jgi:hypothetical protein
MIRTLGIWPDLIAFLATWPQWHRARHAPNPTWAHCRSAYIAARRSHKGQREAMRRLREATNEALRRELGRNAQ